jgi:hypothetical protein
LLLLPTTTSTKEANMARAHLPTFSCSCTVTTTMLPTTQRPWVAGAPIFPYDLVSTSQE